MSNNRSKYDQQKHGGAKRERKSRRTNWDKPNAHDRFFDFRGMDEAYETYLRLEQERKEKKRP